MENESLRQLHQQLESRNLELEALEGDLKNIIALKDEEIERLAATGLTKEELEAIAHRILNGLKLGTQSPQHKSARKALSQFVGAMCKSDSTASVGTQLTHKELRLRLGVPTSTLSQWKIKDGFPEWSRERDPEGIAWQWDEGLKRFILTSN